VNWNSWIRQSHRWVSIAFTLTVIANFLVMGMNGGQQPPPYVTYAPLLPLALLMLSGLYLFALPYVARRRSGRGGFSSS
jgi:quinol-cytochrome oxidoreductase complex cytochrome b subunit